MKVVADALGNIADVLESFADVLDNIVDVLGNNFPLQENEVSTSSFVIFAYIYN